MNLSNSSSGLGSNPKQKYALGELFPSSVLIAALNLLILFNLTSILQNKAHMLTHTSSSC